MTTRKKKSEAFGRLKANDANGFVTFLGQYKKEHPLDKLDLLEDWIDNLTEVYDKLLKEQKT